MQCAINEAVVETSVDGPGVAIVPLYSRDDDYGEAPSTAYSVNRNLAAS